MMEQLVNEVTEKTGLTPDQSRAAVVSVVGFLKQRLPAPLGEALESMVAGGASAEAGSSAEGAAAGGDSLAAEATAVLGSLFGKKN
jgi:hypothetical protein